MAGQIVLPRKEIPHWSVWPSRRRLAMRPQQRARSPVSRSRAQEAMCRSTPLDPDGDLIESGEARSVAGQQVLARTDIAPVVEPHT